MYIYHKCSIQVIWRLLRLGNFWTSINSEIIVKEGEKHEEDMKRGENMPLSSAGEHGNGREFCNFEGVLV